MYKRVYLSKETTSESNHEDGVAVHSSVAGKNWKAAWDYGYLYTGFERKVYLWLSREPLERREL